MSWRKRPVLGPVTALQFSGDLLLAGIGPHLHLYDQDTLLTTQKVLKYERIHSIEKLSSQSDFDSLVCIGIKTFVMIEIHCHDNSIRVSEPWKFQDRVMDVRYLNKAEVAVLFGFNNVVRLDLVQGIQERLQCANCSILYSGKILGNDWNELVLLSGSVFNQVLVWTVVAREEVTSPVLHTLKGHDGVIFSLDYHQEKKLLCSASDDRSIRLWTLVSDEPLLSEAFRTGRFEALVVMYGHTARIWSARLLSNLVVSIGEDGTLCEWNYDGSLSRRVKFQNIKSIRALAVHDSEILVSTAGEDGGIQLHNRTEDLAVQTMTVSLPGEEKDFPREIKFLNDDELLVFTDQGKLYRFKMKTESWTLILQDDHFSGYCCMDVERSEEVVAVGNKAGCIKICDISQSRFVDTQIHDGQKVTPLFFIRIDEQLCVLTTSRRDDGTSQLTLYKVMSSSLTLEVYKTFRLQKAKNAFINSVHYDHGERLLVCGDKEGFISCYRVENERIQILRAHGKGGVSCFITHGGSLYSAGRDGLICTYELGPEGIRLLASDKLVKGIDWIHSIFYHQGRKFLSSFHSTSFQIWRPDSNQKFCDIQCGGGHRITALHVHGCEARFAYIRNASIVVNRIGLSSSQRMVRPSQHGKEITSLIHLLSETVDSKCRHYFATASEDTSCKIISIDDDNEIQVLANLTSHISAVKSIHVMATSNPGEFFLFSCGGRGQLNVWRIQLRGSDCSYKLLDSHWCEDTELGIRYTAVKTCISSDGNSHFIFLAGSDGCVRILSFGVGGKISLRAKSKEQVGCLLDISLVVQSERSTLITCSSSGHVTIWNITELLDELSSSENGAEKKEDTIREFESLSVHQVHRAGISSIAVKEIANALLLASVADDNILKISTVHHDIETGHYKILQKSSHPNQHASNVTGVEFLADRQLLTISSDQRVIVWELADDLSLAVKQFLLSDVPDMMSLCTWSHNGTSCVLVGGVGMQMMITDV